MATGVNNIIVSRYLGRAVVRQRNSVTLAQWSASTVALPTPTPASDDFVRQQVVAQSIPSNLDTFTTQTIGYFLQDPATVADILQFISEDNDDTVEDNLSTVNAAICATFMPRFAQSTVTPQQITDWRTENNAPAA